MSGCQDGGQDLPIFGSRLVAEQPWKWLLEVRAGSVGLVVARSLFDASSGPALFDVSSRPAPFDLLCR